MNIITISYYNLIFLLVVCFCYSVAFVEYSALAQYSRQVFKNQDIAKTNLNGIKQGQIGDCWFESAFAAVINLPKGQKSLTRMIENGPYGTYRVHFNDNDQIYEITQKDINSLPLSKNEALWAKIIETAMYKRFYGFDKSHVQFNTEAGWGEGLTALTGNPIERTNISQLADPELINYLQNNIQMQNPMVCATKSQVTNTYLVHNHAYTILGFDMETYKVKLRNPWGRNPKGVNYYGYRSYNVSTDQKNNQGLIELPLDDFRNDFYVILESYLN